MAIDERIQRIAETLGLSFHARVQICRYVDLVGDVDDDNAWNVMLLARKASFEHERLE